MDPATGFCSGCGRTLDEIARWGSMNDGEREAIMRTLRKRLDPCEKSASEQVSP
jgi:predicted Fe-S protein YdhL (DUF1289 family)